jgi:GT2 family glycosyltransferase
VKPDWERGWRGQLYALGRQRIPLAWRRAIRRRFAPERLFGIRKPRVEIPHHEFDPNEIPHGRPDVVLLPVIPWSYRRQRPQQLAEALARRGHRVLYGTVEGFGEPRVPTPAAPGVLLLPIAGPRAEDLGDRKLDGRVLEAALDSISETRNTFELHAATVILQSPFWTPLALRLREQFGWPIVYDCIDLHAGFPKNRPGFLESEEKRLAAEADLCLATSEVLLDRMRSASSNTCFLPNACDYDRFASVPAPSPADGRVTVGYVGAVDDWFDFVLLADMARLRPGWTFEIVGAVEASRTDRLMNRPNITFFGERAHSELPEFRARFDVEIIPFCLSDLTHSVDPVKAYEAAASGRVVVATPMRSMDRLRRAGIVKSASTAAEFVRSIEQIVSDNDGRRTNTLRSFAAENTWDHRASELSLRIQRLFPLVSIVVVAHNGLDWNRMCLDAIDHRTDWPRVEIVFVDNGSTDGTRQWLLEEAARRGPALRVIPFAENRGFAPAVNAGAAAARGELLCILNNDTLVTRGWLGALVRHLERDPKLGMVGSSTNEIANAAKVDVGYRNLADLDDWARSFVRLNEGRLEPIAMLAMFCVLLPRRVWNAVGPLDERFTVGMFEDDDYSRRIQEQGLHLAVARDSFVHHFGRGTFRAMSEEEYLGVYEQNRARYVAKWTAAPRILPRTATLDEIQERARKRKALIVLPPSVGWDITLVQRPHHLARAFARQGVPVVFEVEDLDGSGRTDVREIAPDLFLLRGDSSRLRALPETILWCFAYNVPALTDQRHARLVYDIIDHAAVFPHAQRRIRRNQRQALGRADAVFAASKPLLESIRRKRSDAVYLPNAVDFGRFAASADSAAVPNALLRAREAGRPLAVYAGALARWVDSDLLGAVMAARTDWTFVIAGEQLDASFRGLVEQDRPNVLFLGSRPHAAIPSILSSCHVGLVPFALGPEGIHASPIKLYEYLAAGLPVVATPVPECQAMPEVLIGRGPEEFSTLLDQARRQGASSEFRAQARERARANSWDRRAATALEVLGIAPNADSNLPDAWPGRIAASPRTASR